MKYLLILGVALLAGCSLEARLLDDQDPDFEFRGYIAYDNQYWDMCWIDCNEVDISCKESSVSDDVCDQMVFSCYQRCNADYCAAGMAGLERCTDWVPTHDNVHQCLQCIDGIDNDCDGLTDDEDPDCLL